MESVSRFFNNTRVSLTAVIFATALCFINILPNRFVWDDVTFILKWPETRRIKITEYFKGAVPVKHEGVYRPLRSVFYALSYRFYGIHAPFYRIQAIVLHLSGTLLVYVFVRKLTERKDLAFFSSLFFGVHPVHTENVAFATASFDLFSPVFFLASLVFFTDYLKKNGPVIALLLSVFFFALSILSGETGLTLPAILLLVFWYVRRNYQKGKKETEKKIEYKNMPAGNKQPVKVAGNIGVKRLFFSLAPFVFALLAYLYLRVGLLGIIARGEFDLYKTVVIWIFMVRAVWRYASILFFPYGLNVDYEVGRESTQIVISRLAPFWQPFVNVYFFLGLLTVLVSVFLFIRTRKKHPLVSFSLIWSLITFLPYSNLIPVNAGVAERYLYLPSVGWSIMVGYILVWLSRLGKKFAYAAYVLAVIITTAFCMRTAVRNTDWKDSYTLWSRTVASSPKSPTALNNLGKAYADRGEYQKALETYRKILEFSPGHRYVHNNIGQVYGMMGDYDSAIEYFSRATEINPAEIDPYNYLAVAYLKKGQREKAAAILEEIGGQNPNHQSLNQLGLIFLEDGDREKAKEYFRSSVRLKENPVALNNLATVLLSEGKYDEAIVYLKKAVEIYPDDPEYYYNLGGAYKMKGDMLVSRMYFEEALRRAPDFEAAKKALDDGLK